MKHGTTNHFHCVKDGCKIVIHYKQPRFGVVHINYVKCETHHKKICRCGYEIGWHNNEQSCKLFPKGKQDLTQCYKVV
jgi:hypothetical protein